MTVVPADANVDLDNLFTDAYDEQYEPHVRVPLVHATEENFEPYGRLVRDYAQEQVLIEEWPVKGWRKLVEGTGTGGGIIEGVYKYFWHKDHLVCIDTTCEDDVLLIGRLAKGDTKNNRKYILIREATYHPDGGQVFYPRDKTPFIAFMALPGDDVKMEDFVAFYCDGSFGIQIKADIWHQAICVACDEAMVLGKQGKVHGRIQLDSVKEFGKYFLVPLQPNVD